MSIDTLLKIEPYIEKFPKSDDHCRVLVLDFDQTLVTATRYLGSESWYKFMEKTIDSSHEFVHDTQYSWAAKVREKNPYTSCESKDKVNELINKFRADGWIVLILTARKTDMLKLTLQNIKEADLPFNEDDILFKKPSPATKPDRFKEWFDAKKVSHSFKNLTVLYIDDSLKYCEQMASLSKIIDKINVNVECFHYCKALPSAEITPQQLNILAVQLGDYVNKETIPLDDDITEEDIQKAKQILSINRICSETLFKKMTEIAEEQNKPFKRLSKGEVELTPLLK